MRGTVFEAAVNAGISGRVIADMHDRMGKENRITRLSPIADLRVRVKMERNTFDELLDAHSVIVRVADATGDPDLIEASMKMGDALGRVGAELFEDHP